MNRETMELICEAKTILLDSRSWADLTSLRAIRPPQPNSENVKTSQTKSPDPNRTGLSVVRGRSWSSGTITRNSPAICCAIACRINKAKVQILCRNVDPACAYHEPRLPELRAVDPLPVRRSHSTAIRPDQLRSALPSGCLGKTPTCRIADVLAARGFVNRRGLRMRSAGISEPGDAGGNIIG